MLRARVLICTCLLMLSVPGWAGGGITLFRQAARRVSAPQEARLQRLISLQMQRAALNAAITSKTARLAHADRTAFLNSPRTLPFQAMATLSAPLAQLPQKVDPLFALRNDQMAFPWFETIEKDLTFLQQQKRALLRILKVRYVSLDEADYSALIPASARKIYVGEEHFQPLIYEAFEKLIFQYQARYPDRKIIILTEFVSDRLFPWQLPGRPVSRLEMPLRRNDSDFKFFNKFLKAGIEIVGLENVAYVKEHEALITPLEDESQSVYGMQERNAHWRNIISYVAKNNPDATLFIYAGSMHTHYRAPFSLATSSPQNFVLQLEVGHLGMDMPFGYVMQKTPFVRTKGGEVSILAWPEKTAFSTRSGFDVCLIFPEEK